MKWIRQIRVISQTKKVANVGEKLTGSNEVFKFVIISSHSCFDKDYNERYQRYNDDEIEKKILKMIKKH